MSILYLIATPPPVLEGTEAVLQEVEVLRRGFDGRMLNLHPLTTSTHRFPKQLVGLHRIAELRELESRSRVNHLYFPSPYAFPVLRLLRNPVFYTVTASLDISKKPRSCSQLRKVRRIIVSNDRDADILKSWGLANYAVIPPAIDSSGIKPAPLPLGAELTLLMASAPWSRGQFELKGIDLLLATAERLPFLRLILLWRGVLADELVRRLERYNLGKRVEVVDRKVAVSDYLARAHATVLLARDGRVVRSFPHSLMESLAGGKPVLLSHAIAMSEFVGAHRCGVVIRDMSVAAIGSAIERLRRDYAELTSYAERIGCVAFPLAPMLESHRRLYEL
jgi:glycosyltransferase involved in cell wall biosynthesis